MNSTTNTPCRLIVLVRPRRIWFLCRLELAHALVTEEAYLR